VSVRKTPTTRVFVSWAFYELLAELKAKTKKSFAELTELIAEVLLGCEDFRRRLEELCALTEGERRWAGFVLSKDEEVCGINLSKEVKDAEREA